MEELPSIFNDLLKTTSLEEKHLMLKALSENIKSLENIPASTRCSNSDPNNTDIQNLVEHVQDAKNYIKKKNFGGRKQSPARFLISISFVNSVEVSKRL